MLLLLLDELVLPLLAPDEPDVHWMRSEGNLAQVCTNSMMLCLTALA